MDRQGPSERVALVTNLRDAFVSWSADSLQLTLPTYFGRHQWMVPMDQVVAGDPTSADISVVEDTFADPLVLPYLFTTGPGMAPNLMLLFRTRQRIPPLKRWAAVNSVGLPFRVSDTRSPEGVLLDGVILRAKDPTGALRRLGGAGVEIVTAPWAWLRDHRSVVTDPIERTRASKHPGSLVWQPAAGWPASTARAVARRPRLILAVSLLGITISMTVQTLANNWKENFAAHADVVIAQVTRTNSYPGDLHTITVRYRRAGRDYETTRNVVSTSPYEIGDPVEVLVDRGDPALAHLEKPGDFLPLLVAGFYVLPAVVGTFGLIWLMWLVFQDGRRRLRSRSSSDLDAAKPHPQSRSTNSFAIASMVLGILWIFWIGSILALVLGHKARKEIDQSGGTQRGRGMAIVGIALGYIELAWFLWLLFAA